MERWLWACCLPVMGLTFAGLRTLSDVTDSGGTGVDPTLFWAILVALGGTISALAGLVYNGERSRRIDAERKLSAYQEIAPDLAADVQWLVEDAEARRLAETGQSSTWPYQRDQSRRPSSHPAKRRRPP